MKSRVNKDKVAEIRERIRRNRAQREAEQYQNGVIQTAGRMDEKEYRIQRALGVKFKLFWGSVEYRASNVIVTYDKITVAAVDEEQAKKKIIARLKKEYGLQEENIVNISISGVPLFR